MGTDESAAINIPAIAAAQTIKAYISQAPDELSLQVRLLYFSYTTGSICRQSTFCVYCMTGAEI